MKRFEPERLDATYSFRKAGMREDSEGRYIEWSQELEDLIEVAKAYKAAEAHSPLGQLADAAYTFGAVHGASAAAAVIKLQPVIPDGPPNVLIQHERVVP